MSDNSPIFKSIQMLDEHTVEIVYNDYARVTVGDVTELYKSLYELTEEKKTARLIIVGKETEITNAARLAVAETNKLHKNLIIAEAIVVHSFYQKMKVNIYLSFIKKSYPTLCFAETKTAKEWLAKKG